MSLAEELLRRREAAVPRGPFNVTPLFAARATGAVITDVEGREYLDFAGGIGVCNVGHAAPRVVAAVREQAGRYLHTCFHVMMYEPYVALAERLNDLVPGGGPHKTLLVNSGAEAVENAVKIARLATGRPAVIAFSDAFHGRTLLAMTLTHKEMPYKQGFGPFAPEVHRVPYAYCYRCPFELTHPACELRCAEALDEVLGDVVPADQVAAVIAEPVLGEGGFVVPPQGWHGRIKQICEAHGMLYIDDEVQAGFGRCARWLAIEHFGVTPDLIVTAKAMGGGLPVSAVTGRAALMDAPHVGGLGGTYGGNPVACAAALAAIETIEQDGLLARAEAIGETVMARFRAMQETHALIGDVRGLGAMCAIELVRDRGSKEPAKEETAALVRRCYESGLITISAGTYGNVMRLLMPLVITDEQLQRGLEILDGALGEIS